MKSEIDLSGLWHVKLDDGTIGNAILPGTLDTNGIGHSDSDKAKWHPDVDVEDNGTMNPVLDNADVIAGRFTRKVTFEGKAAFTRSLTLLPDQIEKWSEKRVFFQVERARKLTLFWNGHEVKAQSGTLSTPWKFEVTNLIQGENQIMVISDNGYHGWPASSIKYSSAASDESQTNWNGMLGDIGLYSEAWVFIKNIRAYPFAVHKRLRVDIEIDQKIPAKRDLTAAGITRNQISASSFTISRRNKREHSGKTLIKIESDALEQPFIQEVDITSKCIEKSQGKVFLTFDGLRLKQDISLWDFEQGNLYKLTVSGTNFSPKEINFGIRDFGKPESPYLTLNGRRIFLLCETNVGLFPEEGHVPMDKAQWIKIIKRYHSYGVNCIRFHSYCPPEAVFQAADEEGMLIQPELSNWDPKSAFETEGAADYYQKEITEILKTYANHPSFVMLTLGNELHCGSAGQKVMNQLLQTAKAIDSTRLFANASNAFYGEKGTDQESDFFTASSYKGEILRGTSQGMQGRINRYLKGTCGNYTDAMDCIRQEYKKPVFAFEVGQYEILPDFHELDKFHGVTNPENLLNVRKYAEKEGLLADWDDRVEASGELALTAYREEVESILRTPEMSGVSLLGLQDFAGQGTALIGMMDSHLEPKPYPFARPENFAKFFRDTQPLAEFDRYVWSGGEILTARILMANYGKKDLTGDLEVSLNDPDEVWTYSQTNAFVGQGRLEELCCVRITLPERDRPVKYSLVIRLDGMDKTYPVWVYPSDWTIQKIKDEADYNQICLTGEIEEAEAALAEGEKVLFAPPATEKNFPHSIETVFTTDFWSVGTYVTQEGYMGVLPDPESPLFVDFPTDRCADWQWYDLTTQARAMELPEKLPADIIAMDCYARLRKLGFVTECRVGKGSLLITSMGLLEKEMSSSAGAMLKSLVDYMVSENFRPTVRISPEELEELAR